MEVNVHGPAPPHWLTAVNVQPQMVDVLPPQPACSKPALGTTFVPSCAVARTDRVACMRALSRTNHALESPYLLVDARGRGNVPVPVAVGVPIVDVGAASLFLA